MTNNLVKVTKWLSYFLALLIVMAATMVSVGRLLTPYLNQHKTELEHWASQLLNVPVEIGHVRISWNGYTPQLTFSKVIILDKTSNKPKFDIGQIKLNAKILESLFNRELILSYINISGMDLTIRSKKSGTLNIEGWGDIAIADNLLGGMNEANEVIAWIVSQPALQLNDIHVTFYTAEGIKKSITLNELSLINSRTKHLLSGKGTLHQDIPTHVELALEWLGNSFDVEKISANLYLYVEGISLPQWFSKQTWNNLQIKEGLGSAKIWLSWDKNQVQKIQTEMQLYNLSLYSLNTAQTQSISRLSGHFGWKRDGKNQVIAGNDILVDLPHHLWPTTSFSLTYPNTSQEPFLLNISYADLGDMYTFAYDSGFLSENIKNMLKSLKPSGEVRDFTLNFQDSVSLENNKISGKFYELSWKPWHSYPGAEGLSGMIEWNGKNGYLDVNSKNLTLIDPTAFDWSVSLGNVIGQIQLQKDKKETWSFYSKKLQLSNDNLQIDTSVAVTMPKDESSNLDITSHFEVKKANQLVHYFPLKMMEPELSRWLKQAFRSGKFVAGKLMIQGRLSDFPFRNQQGKFSVSAEAKDLTFGFALGWPAMKKVNGTIQFVGSSMEATIQSGVLQSMLVKDTKITIPNIEKQKPLIVVLNGMIEGNLAQGMQVIQQSPLKNKLSKEFSAVQLTGPMQLKLNVTLPLKNPEQSSVIGDMEIVQAALSMPTWNMSIDNINGLLHFTEKNIEAHDATARLWGEPIAVQVHTEDTEQGPFVNLQIKGQISDSVMRSFVANTAYSKVIQGGAAYLATVRLAPHQLSEPILLTINTDLKGIALDLPVGFAKKADEVIPSTIIATIKQNKPLELKWVYGNKLTTAATIKNANNGMQLYSAEVRLGDKGEANFQNEPGILISGTLDTLDWNIWKPYFTETSDTSYKDLSDLFRGFDIHTNKIIGLFQPINKAHLELFKGKTDYTLKIDSSDIAGTINFPIKLKPLSIQATFDRLYLAPLADQKELLDPNTLPIINFVGNDVRYHDKRLGRVSFDMSPIKDGIAIESLHVDSGLFNLTAKAEWLLKNKKAETHLDGKLTTNNVAEFLSVWGSPTVNPKGTTGTVLFDLNWPDALYSPVLSDMEGVVDVDLGAGHIINLDQGTNAKMGFGRILNLLSLESISRALTLDFSALTEKGYNFDSIKGQFILKNGNAYTEDVRVEGAVARIEMSGRLGLASKDYDIKLSVTPFVTGSIPVVAALASVNPIVGVVAWVAEKIAGKAVSSATTHYYEVTGPWDKPVWVEK